jgi:Protein of unknown function (DUF2510)
MRWWDGQQWTEHAQPPAAPSQPPQRAHQRPRQPEWRAGQKRDRRILLIASGSILGLLVLLGSCVASLERRTRLTV